MRPSNPWLNLLLWVVLSLVTLFPIYWLFVISVKPAVDLFTTPERHPEELLLEELRRGRSTTRRCAAT